MSAIKEGKEDIIKRLATVWDNYRAGHKSIDDPKNEEVLWGCVFMAATIVELEKGENK